MNQTDRILTTHVGSLPRSEMVCDVVQALDQGTPVSDELFDAVISEAIDVEVERQKRIGVDIVSDGEFSKITYASYVQHRLTGFSGTSPLVTPADLDDFPVAAELSRRRRTPTANSSDPHARDLSACAPVHRSKVTSDGCWPPSPSTSPTEPFSRQPLRGLLPSFTRTGFIPRTRPTSVRSRQLDASRIRFKSRWGQNPSLRMFGGRPGSDRRVGPNLGDSTDAISPTPSNG